MITRFTTVVNEIISLGKVYTTEEQVDKVLRTLPRSWEIKVTAIREAKDLTNMTLNELVPPTKEKNSKKPQSGGYFKRGTTDHQIKDCPMWEVEWRKERAEKEKRELLNKRKNKEKEQAMFAAWGTGSEMYEDESDDIALMAIEESEPEPDSDSKEKEFGDPIVEQRLLFRLNLGASSEGETMGDPSVEPSPSIGIHINWDLNDSNEIRVVNFGKRTMLLGKVIAPVAMCIEFGV
ncbi:hypothetical protein H5410_045251 [Solanum commersonii]|uniref:Uncharacterized protein n=1 Tax=Solanum commersonii TaxID=4109 RepID=A0A9J5X907_SOLCO|nr:hypothetical protein H5410_045251 [Solanum commersonii]